MNGPKASARRRTFQFTIASLLALTTASAFFTCTGRVVLRQIKGHSESPLAANDAFAATLCPLRLPEQARNVEYFARFQGGDAAFDVAESDFLAWAQKYPWKIKEIILSGAVPASWELDNHLSGWPEDVRRVWYYSNTSHRGGWTVMYDRDHGRAYVTFSPR